MPYKFEYKHLVMKKEDDKRIKLTEDDKQEIRKIYNQGLMSQRQLAEKFKVSRRSIQFILDPEKLERNKEQRAEKAKDGRYYRREYQREYMREYRHRKKKLCDEGRLIEKEN